MEHRRGDVDSAGSSEIIEGIGGIYARFRVPPSLADHMLRVASVAGLVCDRWKGPLIDPDAVVAAALLHDIANIVRFDFEGELSRKLLGTELDYYKGVKEAVRAKYGTEEYAARGRMLKELAVESNVMRILENYDTERLSESADEWEAKICSYADGRVGPHGVLPIRERFADLMGRRSRSSAAKLRRIERAELAIERQVLRNTDLSPDAISDASTAPYLSKYGRGAKRR